MLSTLRARELTLAGVLTVVDMLNVQNYGENWPDYYNYESLFALLVQQHRYRQYNTKFNIVK